MPSSRSRKCTCKGGPFVLGGSVPSRNRTIRPSASRLRCIRKISPLWRFSNLRKLSTIHPTCGPCVPKTSSYESYHWAHQLAANRSQKRSGVIILALLTIRKLASQKSASGKLHILVQIVHSETGSSITTCLHYSHQIASAVPMKTARSGTLARPRVRDSLEPKPWRQMPAAYFRSALSRAFVSVLAVNGLLTSCISGSAAIWLTIVRSA